MADSTIGNLPLATTVFGDDLFVLEQDSTAKKLSGSTLSEFIDRHFLTVSVTELPSTDSPTASYDTITGRLTLGIPRGIGIRAISKDSDNIIHYIFDDGSEWAVESVKGETGLSAYGYAVQAGYEGTEPEYQQMMLDLFEAAQNEAERVEAEELRRTQYTQIYNNTQAQLDRFEDLMEYADSKVVNTTLMLYRGGVRLFDTTLML